MTNAPTGERRFGPDPVLSAAIQSVLEEAGWWGRWKELARAVHDLSTHFINQSGPTPWVTEAQQMAYLAYFLPLNVARLKAVWWELMSVGFPVARQVVDFGSGPGTVGFSWPQELPVDLWESWETSPPAIKLHQRLALKLDSAVKPQWPKILPDFENKLLIASYAFNELAEWPEELFSASAIVIVEPSHQPVARRLLQWRQGAIDKGFSVWAPCVHQKGCPLLLHSERDWCHDRVFFSPPPWWEDLEAHLPIRNRTITFSYLAVAQKPRPPVAHEARLIGDTLFEKGKVRQALCRGDQREFASWLLKHHPSPPVLPHGSRVLLPEDCTFHGPEVRPQSSVTRLS